MDDARRHQKLKRYLGYYGTNVNRPWRNRTAKRPERLAKCICRMYILLSNMHGELKSGYQKPKRSEEGRVNQITKKIMQASSCTGSMVLELVN